MPNSTLLCHLDRESLGWDSSARQQWHATDHEDHARSLPRLHRGEKHNREECFWQNDNTALAPPWRTLGYIVSRYLWREGACFEQTRLQLGTVGPLLLYPGLFGTGGIPGRAVNGGRIARGHGCAPHHHEDEHRRLAEDPVESSSPCRQPRTPRPSPSVLLVCVPVWFERAVESSTVGSPQAGRRVDRRRRDRACLRGPLRSP